MKKSTYVHSTGKIWLKACEGENGCGEDCFYCQKRLMEKALERLASYEATGPEPEEIKAEFSLTEITPEGVICTVSKMKVGGE